MSANGTDRDKPREDQSFWFSPAHNPLGMLDSQMGPNMLWLNVYLWDQMADELWNAVKSLTALLRRAVSRSPTSARGRTARSPTVSCDVTYRELAAYTAEQIDATRQAELRKHMAHCDRCTERLESLNKADAALATLPPEGLAEQAMEMAVVGAAIAGLPDHQREAIGHYAFEQMSCPDVADALDMPIATVEELIHRARANLARALERRPHQRKREPSRAGSPSIWSI